MPGRSSDLFRNRCAFPALSVPVAKATEHILRIVRAVVSGNGGRLRGLRAARHKTNASTHREPAEPNDRYPDPGTYSSGNCCRFSRHSLLIPCATMGTDAGAKVCLIFGGCNKVLQIFSTATPRPAPERIPSTATKHISTFLHRASHYGLACNLGNKYPVYIKIYVIVNSETLLLLNYIYECQTKCKSCFNRCLEEQSLDVMRKCLKVTVECANVCELTASSIMFEGDFSPEMLDICISSCEACRIECSTHNNIYCAECAAMCGECSEACRKYIRENILHPVYP